MFCWIFSTSGCGFQVISLLFPITAPNILNKCKSCSSYTCYSRGLSLPPNRTSPQAGQYPKERRSYNPCITNGKLELSLMTSFAKFLKQVWLDDLPTRARRSVTAPGRVQSVKSRWINWSVSVLWNPCISKSITSLQPGTEGEVRTWLLQPWVAWVRQNRKKGTTLVLNFVLQNGTAGNKLLFLSIFMGIHWYNPDGMYWLGIHDALEIV